MYYSCLILFITLLAGHTDRMCNSTSFNCDVNEAMTYFLADPGDNGGMGDLKVFDSGLVAVMDVTSPGVGNSTVPDRWGPGPPSPSSTEAIVLLSALFCIIGTTGTVGNLLVIIVILADKKMRRSVTNIFIMNLAVADLLIMLFGIPEIVQFIMNRGWVLGPVLCRVQRSILVCSLYASIMTLMGVCIERFVLSI